MVKEYCFQLINFPETYLGSREEIYSCNRTKTRCMATSKNPTSLLEYDNRVASRLCPNYNSLHDVATNQVFFRKGSIFEQKQ